MNVETTVDKLNRLNKTIEKDFYTAVIERRGYNIYRNSLPKSNLFAKWIMVNNTLFYGVFSYGTHFPIILWDTINEEWLINTNKHSRTTTRHQNKVKSMFPFINQTAKELSTIRIIGYMYGIRGE